jgi:hypothetical protein
MSLKDSVHVKGEAEGLHGAIDAIIKQSLAAGVSPQTLFQQLVAALAVFIGSNVSAEGRAEMIKRVAEDLPGFVEYARKADAIMRSNVVGHA